MAGSTTVLKVQISSPSEETERDEGICERVTEGRRVTSEAVQFFDSLSLFNYKVE